jgi:hypothetical protein
MKNILQNILEMEKKSLPEIRDGKNILNFILSVNNITYIKICMKIYLLTLFGSVILSLEEVALLLF